MLRSSFEKLWTSSSVRLLLLPWSMFPVCIPHERWALTRWPAMEASLEPKAHFKTSGWKWLEIIQALGYLFCGPSCSSSTKSEDCETELTLRIWPGREVLGLPNPNSLYSNCWGTSCQRYSAQTLEGQWLLWLMLPPTYTAARHPSPNTNLKFTT